MKAIRVHETGGPDVLRYEDVTEPQPRTGEVLVRLGAVHAADAQRALESRRLAGKILLVP